MTLLRQILICALLVAGIAAVLSVPLNFGLPKYFVDVLSDKLAEAVAHEGDATRAAALIGLAETRADILARVDRLTSVAQSEIRATRTEASAHVVGLASVLDGRLGAIQADANRHAAVLEGLTAHELGRAVDGWVAVARPVGSVAAQVNDAAPLFLDCEFNPDCAFNRFQGTSKAVEKASMTFAAKWPELLDTAQQTNRSVAGIAASADRWVGYQLRPRTKKEITLGYIEKVAILGLRTYLLL